jgi:F-type H+-transporting ATPase subunit epsilon
MMARVMRVDLVDSEKQIFSGEVEYLVAPAANGEIGVYPHHTSLLTKLKPGVLRLQIAEEQYQMIFAISGGFLEVQDNHATVLADIVERTDELDEARLKEQKAIALARYKKRAGSSSTTDIARAQASLEIAIAQLKALDYIKRQARRA